MEKKYQWAIRSGSDGFYCVDGMGSPGFFYDEHLDNATLWPTAQWAADRLERRQSVYGLSLFVLVPVRVTEETITEVVTRVVGTKRSLT